MLISNTSLIPVRLSYFSISSYLSKLEPKQCGIIYIIKADVIFHLSYTVCDLHAHMQHIHAYLTLCVRDLHLLNTVPSHSVMTVPTLG